MKQRIISAAVALVALVVALFLFDTYIFNIVVALVVLIAVFEFLRAEGCNKTASLSVSSCVYAALIPLIPLDWMQRVFPLLTFLYIVVLFFTLLRYHDRINALQIAFAFFISLLLPFSITLFIHMRSTHGVPTALFYLLIALASSWISDTGAYFAGRAFGRHKLAPAISPKKTVEGVIGGVVLNLVGSLLLAAVYQWAAARFFAVSCEIRFLPLALLLPVFSLIGVVGDLSASVIKRQSGIKDYGNIMPGHGGVADRFDSVFFTAPCVFFVAQFIPLFHVL